MAIPPEKNTRPEPVCPELSCPLDSAGSRAALFAGTGDSAARFSLGQFYIEATDSLCALYPRQEAAAIVSVLLQERLGVPAYLSGLLHIPYWALVSSLLVGQFISGLVGMLLVKALKRGFLREN